MPTARHYVSKLFQPITNVSKTANMPRQEVTSKSQRLMLELGLIQQANPGSLHLLPLSLKSLNKLIQIVDDEMFKIGGQKMLFPSLINSNLWKISGRLDIVGSELFQLKDRHNHRYILSPTHEEVASSLLAEIPISFKNLPLRLYQISNKFRDEMKPRFGLMRGREFLMKDLYSFDSNLENAKKTYEEICQSYDNIFTKIGIDFIKVHGTSGVMGGNLSHEYQFKADVGEDKVLTCLKCGYLANVELSGDQKCPKCNDGSKITVQNGIEVGHTFLLGDKYTKPLKTKYLKENGKPETLIMGSFGLGLGRILAASLEVLSLERELRWPNVLAPYLVYIIGPKAGSKEEAQTKGLDIELYDKLERAINLLKDNILLDDRSSLTIGRRFLDAKRTGFPFVIVINQKTIGDSPLYELNDLKNNKQLHLNENDLFTYIKQCSALENL